MLLEKTAYTDDFPINITIAKVTEYPFHYHQDVEIIYVLKGEIRLKNVCHNYVLREGDIFTNSAHEIHGLTATEKENIVAFIQISNRFFTRYFPTLGKACFMSYAKNDKYLKMDKLRKMLLNILLDYSRKSFDYKNICIDQTIEVIKYLNENFNLFAFENQDVVSFKSNDPVAIERISRIITYIYENHAARLTLKDLSDREHLSTFYISHLIHDCIGMNFQEFLCFARVEMSEILLLETDHKISTIAKDVGFSTTSYYEKFFRKWFGLMPEEYRKRYTPFILSASRPPKIESLSSNQAISIVRRCMTAACGQDKNPSVVGRLYLNVYVDPQTQPMMTVSHSLEVVITHEDYNVMGDRLFNILYNLNTSKVIIALRKGDNDATTSLISNRLRFAGYDVSVSYENNLETGTSSAYDSIASAIRIFYSSFTSKENDLHCRLRDQGKTTDILKGYPACITSCMIPKPLFYSYLFLKNIKGNLLYWSKYYYVIQNNFLGKDSYAIVVFNYNNDILNLCNRKASKYESCDIINAFKDELNVDFTIPLPKGKYITAKYAISESNSIFGNMCQIGFPEAFPLDQQWLSMLNTAPQSQIGIEDVEDILNISTVIKGAGINVIIIDKINCT